jgi:hypothetical protein
MKTTKLAIGICGAVMAMAALAAPAPAQVSKGTDGRGGGGGVLTHVLRPIIYDYETAAPNPVHRRHLKILADGTATLADTAGARIRVLKRRIRPADMAELDALAAKLGGPGDVSTGLASDGPPDPKLTIGLVGVRRHVVMGRPVSRMLVRKLEQIAAELAGE